MKKLYFFILSMAALQITFAQTVSITNLASPYQQDFNTLANTGSSALLPTGWLLSETGTSLNANGQYTAGDGTANAGDAYSFGPAGNTERAFGGLQSGSLNPTVGVGFTNNSGSTITSLTLTYFGEQWRLGTLSRVDRMDFQYSLNAASLTTGTYTDVDALDFTAPITTGTVGALDGNVAANRTQKTFTIVGLSIAAGSSFYLRWNDLNATSSDDGLGVDDVTITFNGATLPACVVPTAQPGALSFSGVTTSSMNVSFIAASPAPDEYLAVISTNPVLGGAPANGTTYINDDAIGNGTVIYRGFNTSFTASALAAGTTYYYSIFSVSSNCTGGPLYKTDNPATANQATNTPPVCAAPLTQVSNVIFTSVTGTSINGSFTAATDADGYLVCISTNSVLGFTPVNGSVYAVGDAAGNGTVIKFGQGNTFGKSGLTVSTTYYFTFFPLNQFTCTGGPLYNSNGLAASTTTGSGGNGIPAGYYDAITTQTCGDLKTALKTRTITGMIARPYSSLWDQYRLTDLKPREVGTGSANVIWDIYSDNPSGPDPYNFDPVTQQDMGSGGGTEGQFFNREHSVPQSWFNGNASSNTIGPESDYNHVFPTDKKVNSIRGNLIFGEVATPTLTTLNGSKTGSSAFAGITGTVFEPINQYKGDVARAFLYFVTRYEANMSGYPGDNTGQSFDQNIFPSVKINYLRLMLKWHNQDPVSQKEIDRNNGNYAFQVNRNPFIDHPEYADIVWNSTCTGLAALPVDILFFKGFLKGSAIRLEWETANAQNLLQYEVERSVNGKDFSRIGIVKATNATLYNYSDDVNQLSGRRLYYRLKKVDNDGRFKYSEVFTTHVPLNLQFTVYPNPVVDEFAKVQFTKPTVRNASLLVTDMAGRTHQQIPVAAGTINIIVNLKNVPAGMYIIKLVQDGNTVMQKIQVL